MNNMPDISKIKLNEKFYVESGNELSLLDNEPEIHRDIHALLSVYTGGSGRDRSLSIQELLQGYQISNGALMTDPPIITIIHKDGFVADIIDVVREGLPLSRQHLAVNKVLANRKESAINPLEIKIGFDKPIPRERQYIKEFLLTLLTPMEAEKPYGGIEGLVDVLIDRVYELTHGIDAAIPKLFDTKHSRELNTWAARHLTDHDLENGVTVQTIANRLHVAGECEDKDSEEREFLWRARDIAHSLAMPVLADLIKTMDIAHLDMHYTNTVETGETVVQYTRRLLGDAIKHFPCFANPTTFNINASRVVAIDLQDVDAGDNHRINSLFFQVARMAGMKKMNYCFSDLMLSDLNGIYENYYKGLARELEDSRKAFVIEGIDYYKYDKRLLESLEVDARERRRLGVNLIISTDNLGDFHDETNTYTAVSDANRLYIFAGFEGDNLAAFNKMFTSNETVMADIENMNELAYMSYVRPYRSSLRVTRYHLNRSLMLNQATDYEEGK